MTKFKSTSESKNWVSSDWHLGHQREFVWGARGYKTHQEHTDGVINGINDNVLPNDNLFYLGDFSLNSNDQLFNEYLSRINCQNIYMLWGNHNSPGKNIYKKTVLEQYLRDDISVYPIRYRNVIFVGDYLEVSIDGKYNIMMHYPIEIWNYMKDGSYMLCGHSHYNFQKTKKESNEGLILDCGWDGHGKPYLFSEIVEIMNEKKIKAVDHHVK